MNDRLVHAIILFAFSIAAMLVAAQLDYDSIASGIAGGSFVAAYTRFLDWMTWRAGRSSAEEP